MAYGVTKVGKATWTIVEHGQRDGHIDGRRREGTKGNRQTRLPGENSPGEESRAKEDQAEEHRSEERRVEGVLKQRKGLREKIPWVVKPPGRGGLHAEGRRAARTRKDQVCEKEQRTMRS